MPACHPILLHLEASVHHLHLLWSDTQQADPLVRPAHKLIFLVLDRPPHASVVGIVVVEFLTVHVLICIVHRWIVRGSIHLRLRLLSVESLSGGRFVPVVLSQQLNHLVHVLNVADCAQVFNCHGHLLVILGRSPTS